LKAEVRRVAVIGGSGGDYIETALQKGADVFITGDLKFHQAQQAALYGLPLIDAGHDATEWPAIPALAAFLREKMRQNNYHTEILVSKIRKKMWQIIS
jgi:putative NIF3 family GTP cyclohydrolase 1 type 2